MFFVLFRIYVIETCICGRLREHVRMPPPPPKYATGCVYTIGIIDRMRAPISFQ